MADAASAAPEPDNRRVEFLLKLNSDRVTGLESALERNWIAHLILAGVGLALVLHIGNFRELLANYFIRGPYDQTAVAACVLAILLYYFMKLGHLLTLYVEASRHQSRLLADYLGEHFDANKTILAKSTNFYVEAFFSIKTPNARDTFWPYLLVTTTVVSLAQAAALFLGAQAFGLNRWYPSQVFVSCAFLIAYIVFLRAFQHPRIVLTFATGLLAAVAAVLFTLSVKSGWPSLILLLAGAIIVTLYLLFWSSNKDFPQTRLAVVSSPVFVTLWLVVFAIARR